MKWGLIALPLIIVICVGWFNVSVVQSGCITLTNDPRCNIDASGTVFSNPIGFLLGGLVPQNVPFVQGVTDYCGKGTSNWGRDIFGVCIPIPTFSQIGYALQQTWSSAASTGSVLFGLVGFAMIMFAIFGNAKVLDTGLNLTDSNTRLLVAMGLGYMVWGYSTNFVSIIYDIPYNLGFILMSVLTFIYSFGIYDLGRTIA